MNKTQYYIWVSEQNQYNDIDIETAGSYLNEALSKGMKVIDIESDEYPDKLRMIEKPPLVLYCIGDTSLLKQAEVAVVGTRRASAYGKWIAGEIASVLAENNVVHVSGMAEGIDSAGHRAVLSAKGKSIAVLGTGADICFPVSSRKIYEDLRLNGLIVSEYRPGTTGYRANFPKRNRIISGLTDKVVIVEGALRSGSLITARIALEQGKDIYAVPGNINQPNSIGPNLLISDGAIPIANPSEIAETLGIVRMKKKSREYVLSDTEKDVLFLVRDAGSITADEIKTALDVPADNLMAALTVLELQGIVRNEDGIVRM